jgi:pyruvate-formate lyase-activating enzyme
MTRSILRIEEHSRDSTGMKYVYAVVSRRAEGVSIGINLNPNNACNWRCVYCQVPGLTRGGPPPIDLDQLRRELERMLDDVVGGDFMEQRVAQSARRLMDISFSGNGEPTSAREFAAAVALVTDMVARRGLVGKLMVRLITNGSLMDRREVKNGVALLGSAGGEVWFKIDRATPAAIARVNNVRVAPTSMERRLRVCASLCPVWVQSCWFAIDGMSPSDAEVKAYVALIKRHADVLRGVHLYGLARASMQPEAPRLTPVSADWLEALAQRLRTAGVMAKVSL